MSTSQINSPETSSILDVESNNIAKPPVFLESEANQAIKDENINNNNNNNNNANLDSVYPPNKAISDQKKLEAIQKIIEDRNRIISSSKITKKKRKIKRKHRKCKTRDDENNEFIEESPKHAKNPRFSKFSQQSEETIGQQGETPSQASFEQPQVLGPNKKIRKRFHKKKKEQINKHETATDQANISRQKTLKRKRKVKRRVRKIKKFDDGKSITENQEIMIETETDCSKQYPVHQPQEPNQNSFKRSKKSIQNQSQIGEDPIDSNRSILYNSPNDEISEHPVKKRPYFKADNLVINENARRAKDEELLKKRENYNKLKEKKWKEFLKEQEKRKRLIYGSKCGHHVDLFSEKIKNQNQKEKEIQIYFSPKRQQQDPNANSEDVKSQKKPKKNQRKNKQKNNKNIDDNSSTKNLLNSTKNRPKVVVPNTMQLSSNKKWNGKSRIPRFVGTQQLSDFY